MGWIKLMKGRTTEWIIDQILTLKKSLPQLEGKFKEQVEMNIEIMEDELTYRSNGDPVAQFAERVLGEPTGRKSKDV